MEFLVRTPRTPCHLKGLPCVPTTRWPIPRPPWCRCVPSVLGFDIAYYASTLVLAYSLRQRRSERVGIFVTNGNVAYADGPVESLTLRCEDVSVDPNAKPYLPGQNVVAGDVRRVGWYNWVVKQPHVTRGPFSQDLYAADGSERWELLRTNGSPLGSPNAETLFTAPRGIQVLVAGVHKALKKIALSQRSIEIRFTVPLEDWPDVSTSWAAELEDIPERLLPGGTAWAKVTSVEMGQDSLKDYPKAVVTITAVDGIGMPGPGQADGVNPTGELWDGVVLDQPAGVPVGAAPVPGVVIQVQNAPGDQVAYVQARDWTGDPGRDDRTLNDPHHLLTESRTKLVIAGIPISRGSRPSSPTSPWAARPGAAPTSSTSQRCSHEPARRRTRPPRPALHRGPGPHAGCRRPGEPGRAGDALLRHGQRPRRRPAVGRAGQPRGP